MFKTEVICSTHFILLLVILLLLRLLYLLLLSLLFLRSAPNETLPFLPTAVLYRGYQQPPIQSHSQTLSLGMRLPPVL